MDTINRNQVTELARMPEAISLSIFLPTHREGEETLKQKDALALKNMLKSVKERLQQLGINRKETERFTDPLRDLIEDKAFWRQQSHSLAVFVRDGFFRTYAVPVKLPAFHHISHQFFLLPLFPLFSEDGKFQLLALTLHHVRFYEVSRFDMARVIPEDFVPSRPEEVVGFDYEQKNLQFRNQGGGESQTIFHGQGEGKEDRKNEILRFFRAVNKGLINTLNEENLPLVVATMDHLFPIYQEANTYVHLRKEPITCNPADMTREALHELAWKSMEPAFEAEKERKKELFGQFENNERTDTDLRKIFPKAKMGLVDTLFFQNSVRWEDLGSMVENPAPDNLSTELSALNQTAIAVFTQGGEVYAFPKEKLPAPNALANALYRY